MFHIISTTKKKKNDILLHVGYFFYSLKLSMRALRHVFEHRMWVFTYFLLELGTVIKSSWERHHGWQFGFCLLLKEERIYQICQKHWPHSHFIEDIIVWETVVHGVEKMELEEDFSAQSSPWLCDLIQSTNFYNFQL